MVFLSFRQGFLVIFLCLFSSRTLSFFQGLLSQFGTWYALFFLKRDADKFQNHLPLVRLFAVGKAHGIGGAGTKMEQAQLFHLFGI